MPKGRPRASVRPCNFCHKQFKRLEHLQRHERIHTHEKPFPCDCGQRFARQDLLARHFRLSHGVNSAEAPVTASTEGVPLNQTFEPSGIRAIDHYHATNEPTLQLENDMSLHETAPLVRSPQAPEAQHVFQQSEPDYPTNHVSAPVQLSNVTALPDLFLDQSDNLDILWNASCTDYDFLPARYFDTDFSLVDISQQSIGLPHASQANFTAPLTQQPMGSCEGQNPSVNNDIQPALVSRLPSLEPTPRQWGENHLSEGQAPGRENGETERASMHSWRITSTGYEKITKELAELNDRLPGSFTLPTRHSLSRYLEGYFRGFHDHLPFFHIPTFSAVHVGLELLLALAAVGALYRFEHAKGYELYRAAQTIIHWRLDQIRGHALSRLTGTSPGYARLTNHHLQSQTRDPAAEQPSPEPKGRSHLCLLQGMLVLMALTAWSDHALMRESLAMSSQVAMLVRDLEINDFEDTTSGSSWGEWIDCEERRRTLLVAYVLFNLQCIAFHVPPMIPNQEVTISLPASAAEWKASSATQWANLRSGKGPKPRSFQRTLDQLLAGNLIHREEPITAFGNYVLIHGLVQHIFFVRSAASCQADSTSPLPAAFVKSMESALRAWQESWEATHESTLDPSSPKGPLGFNASALLRLAYIRLNANLGPSRRLISRDPVCIARTFTDGPTHICERSLHLDRAVLQCIHALSVPVRVGIAFVARTQSLNWSIQHSLCNLECAFLLTQWLESVAEFVTRQGLASLREDERKLLGMIVSLLQETDMAEDIDRREDDAARIRRLAACTMGLWAETFQGFHVFEIVHLVGTSLSIVADILQSRLAT
ncbi:hypothetical protein N7530_002416 [Penicillium desertorum]|uniref:C2H2-type domain-containing protein n=1 Tax=Penicillium desertorum TaxID=1303715 RepID=A0A9W9X3X9_9EURO|nr:hypothetical protein N7530_002416 [Penicillium desertorum]